MTRFRFLQVGRRSSDFDREVGGVEGVLKGFTFGHLAERIKGGYASPGLLKYSVGSLHYFDDPNQREIILLARSLGRKEGMTLSEVSDLIKVGPIYVKAEILTRVGENIRGVDEELLSSFMRGYGFRGLVDTDVVSDRFVKEPEFVTEKPGPSLVVFRSF